MIRSSTTGHHSSSTNRTIHNVPPSERLSSDGPPEDRALVSTSCLSIVGLMEGIQLGNSVFATDRRVAQAAKSLVEQEGIGRLMELSCFHLEDDWKCTKSVCGKVFQSCPPAASILSKASSKRSFVKTWEVPLSKVV